MTIQCRDCDAVPKVPDAGQVVTIGNETVQVMHNGLKVVAGGYHGDWMAHIIRGLKGHHEPQEELVFHALLRYTRHNSLFVELGAFWAYYSMWYLKEIPGSEAICVEPDPLHIEIGKANARLNDLADRATFTEAWVGGSALPDVEFRCETTQQMRALPMLNMPAVLDLANGRSVEFLHIDVQGAELAFINSMEQAVSEGRLRFLMVSTHHRAISGSATTHQDCLAAIRGMGGHVLCEHDIQQSFSGDGLIAASFFPQDAQLILPAISRNEAARSLFPEP
jgi:FkbM family methyltransferase